MACSKIPTSGVQVRITLNVDRLWYFSVEVYKGHKTYACEGSAATRHHAEQLAEEFTAMILNPTEACA